MSAPRAIVLRAAGTNCDEETVRALETAGAEVALVHLHALLHDPGTLRDARLLVLPGGFSYGDDVAAGRVFGVELRQHLADELRAFVDGDGHVLGICNGFQVLVELGLFEPDRAPGDRAIALTDNASGRFEARWTTLRAEPSTCAWLEPGGLLPCPVAHAEGRLAVRDPATLDDLRARGQVALRYVAADGGPARYPDNPNGSVDDVAGLADPTGRVLGLMPHPERNLAPWSHPLWTRLPERREGEGVAFFRRLVDAAAGRVPVAAPRSRSRSRS